MHAVYFAPMEGLTDAVFRRVHHECFSGVTRYYIPFISPTQHLVLNGREKHNIEPQYNQGVPCVPQILTKNAEHFLWAARLLGDMGYDEVNLNVGCPSGTVTAKGKGAGMLRDPDGLSRFLDTVCAQSPVPVSIKTRIGFESPAEWERLLQIYVAYPIKKLIVHPRTCRERYDPAHLHRECLHPLCDPADTGIVVNGDLFCRSDIDDLYTRMPALDGVMLGRGLVANPALGRVLNGGEPLSRAEVVHFAARLEEELLRQYQPDIVFMKLRVVMKHLACCFADTGKLEKQIRKSRRLPELDAVMQRLFGECELKPEPCFVPDELRNGEV